MKWKQLFGRLLDALGTSGLYQLRLYQAVQSRFTPFNKNGVLGVFGYKPNVNGNEFSSGDIWPFPRLHGQTAHSTIFQTCPLPRSTVKGGCFCDNGDRLVHVPSIPYSRRSTIRLAFLRTSILYLIQCGELVFPSAGCISLRFSVLTPSDPFPLPGHPSCIPSFRSQMYPFSCSGRALNISIRYEPNNTGCAIPFSIGITFSVISWPASTQLLA